MHNPPMPGTRTRPVTLSGLRGFEAAARRLSFTLAAEELRLTQSSISRQVKSLEDQVGRRLFRRGTRSLALTEAGEQLHRAVRDALRGVDATVDALRGRSARKRVTLTTAASLASLVLVPRLPSFSAAHPAIDIRIDGSDLPRDLRAESMDVALRYYPHARAPRGLALLHAERLLPVTSPALARRLGRLRGPADLGRATLLVEDGPTDADGGHWERWFVAQRARMPADAPRLMLSFTHQALDAALRGQGVMLAPELFVREHLAAGRLVAPLGGAPTPSGFGYYLLSNPDTARTRHVGAFVEWLRAVFDPAVPG
jgi:DNA-binding transcriptional LysR family regulator